MKGSMTFAWQISIILHTLCIYKHVTYIKSAHVMLKMLILGSRLFIHHCVPIRNKITSVKYLTLCEYFGKFKY